MALLILALLQRIFLMSSLMLLLVWLIFFMVLIKLLPILGTISGKTVKLMVLRSEERRVGKEWRNWGAQNVTKTYAKPSRKKPPRIASRGVRAAKRWLVFFFFKQKTAYEIGLGIPAEPLFRSTAKDISNVVTDAASGVVDIFHGIDKAVADTWNNFWKDGKADGIGSNLSRK